MISLRRFFLKENKKNLAFVLGVCVMLFVSFSYVTYAQSIADVCGQSVDQKKCQLSDIPLVTKGILSLIVSIGLPVLICYIAYRFVMAYFAAVQGNAMAYKDAVKKAGNAILGFFFIAGLFGGLFYAMLKYLGVKDAPIQFLQFFSDAFTFIPHAYAAGESTSNGYLPNFIGVNSLSEFLLAMVRLVIRFFVYPALIVMWVWTGFSFILAQGNPDGLRKAKKWLLGAIITTLVIFMLQMFLLAVQGTINKIINKDTSQQQTQQQTTQPQAQDQYKPEPGQAGASCQVKDTGAYGTIGTDGNCYSGGGR
jgi:TRAP-type C4-dicarboxylate transport system permease small subunit